MSLIKVAGLKKIFTKYDDNNEIESSREVLRDINMDVEKGDFVAILGSNGSGKTTFARHLNALLFSDEGTVTIDGEDTKSVKNIWEIRKKCGMVFQNPDNQIVGVTVEEDAAFGLENLGVEPIKMQKRVNESLNKTGLGKYKQKSPSRLSGGQKQRLSIASSISMRPKCLILDEPTAMLDPAGRKDVMKIVKELNKEDKMTIIYITHHMDEAAKADKIFVLNKGEVVTCGTPFEVFQKVDVLEQAKLTIPYVTKVAKIMNNCGFLKAYNYYNVDELIENFFKENDVSSFNSKIRKASEVSSRKKDLEKETDISRDCILSLSNVSLCYDKGLSFENSAINNVSLNIYKDEFIGIIGHTGSGKSSLVQLMDGLIKPTDGTVKFKGMDINDKDFNKRELHFKVGMVFQYPENQLFEESVIKDVMFGPLNQGISQELAQNKGEKALEIMGISKDRFEASPFELSGGEKRRVAIAGVIAMEPEIIILDEPVAGLDPETSSILLCALKDLRDKGKTVILISHDMENVAEYTDRVLVMNQGSVVMDDTTENVFKNQVKLKEIGLDIPIPKEVMLRLYKAGYNVNTNVLTLKDIEKELK